VKYGTRNGVVTLREQKCCRSKDAEVIEIYDKMLVVFGWVLYGLVGSLTSCDRMVIRDNGLLLVRSIYVKCLSSLFT
jgi:hypothetical protein